MFLDEFYTKIKQGLISFFNVGGGSYNQVYRTTEPQTVLNNHSLWILKIPKYAEDDFFPLNKPGRAIRKWRAINPDIPAYILGGDEIWITPFLGTTKPSDELINQTVIDIYHRTGNIIVDACITSNFVLFEGRAVCIDMDLAIHRDSLTSEVYYNDTIASEKFDEFFQNSIAYNTPKTQATIKTLLYLEDELSDYEFNRAEITIWVIEKLNFFRERSQIIHYNTIEILNFLQMNHVSEEFIVPEYLNELSLQWREDLGLESVMQILVDIRDRLSMSSAITPPGHGFFECLGKRSTYEEIIEHIELSMRK